MGILDAAQQAMKSAASMFAGNAAKPEDRVVGTGDVGPSINPNQPGIQLVTLPLTEADITAWWERIETARQRVKQRETTWDMLLRAYLPSVTSGAEEVKVNAHFRNVHSKIGQIFFLNPDIVCTPDDMSPAMNQKPNPMQQFAPIDPMTGVQAQLPPLTMEDVIVVKQAVLKKTMGRDGMKTNRLMDELLFDVLAWAGIGCCKGGYTCTFKTIKVPRMVPVSMPQSTNPLMLAPTPPIDPQTGAPMQEQAKDPVTGELQFDMEPVPVYEEWYARRFSPKKVLFDGDLSSTRFDEDATWIGMEFYLSPRQAKAMLQMTDDEIASATAEDDRKFEYSEDAANKGKPGLVHCVEIFCKAAHFTDEVHPLAINQLILVDKINTKAFVWRPSADQTFDERGRLTKDSIDRFPIRILTIRDLADSPFPPSDGAFTNNLIKEINTHRRQSIKLRDAAIGKYVIDVGALEDGDIDQIKNGEPGDFIVLTSGAMKDGVDKVVALVAQAHSAPDDWRLAEQLKTDMNETLGLGGPQAGGETDTVRTATEIATMTQAMNSRNQKEQSRAVDFWLDLARFTDQLLMRYATEDQYISIAGEEGVNIIRMWNNEMVAGKYLYEIAPDSSLHADSQSDFRDTLELYNLAAPDPLFNRKYVLRKLARFKGMDPNKVVLSQQAIPTQPPHGGTSSAGSVVNKHQATTSGKRPNEPQVSGGPGPAGGKREGAVQ